MKKEKMNVLFREDTRGPLDEYSREQAIRQEACANVVTISGDMTHWCAFHDSYCLTCIGPRIFWKKTMTVRAGYKDGKLYGSLELFKQHLMDIFHLDWVRTNKWTLKLLREDKFFWKQVLTGKITNPEQLAKAYSKKYFQSAYTYKTLKNYFELCPNRVSLWDFFYYTMNPEENLKAIIKKPYLESLDTDIIQYAKILNERVDLRWSARRLHEEHQRQIEAVNASKADKFSDEDIATPLKMDGLSLILNEKECFLEGSTMHNCVHSCYWRRITEGNYLLAHGEALGEYVDLGMKILDGEVFLDQVHTIYNGNPSKAAERFCEEWIRLRSLWLLEVSKEIKNNHILESVVDTGEYTPLPF